MFRPTQHSTIPAHTRKPSRSLLIAVAVSLSLLLPVIVNAGGQDQIRTTWPVGPMSTAEAYGVDVIPESLNADVGTYVTGWLALDFTADLSGTFTQVGTVAQSSHWHWFVYSQVQVACLRGTPQGDGHTCNGDFEDLVNQSETSRVDLYFGYTLIFGPSWAAQVYGISAYTGQLEADEVAYIGEGSNQIYKAQITSEESFNTFDDLGLDLSFYYYHPIYASGGSYADFLSPGTIDAPFPRDPGSPPTSSICPTPYGGVYPNLGGDSRYWYAGTRGITCSGTIP
jgi:hypothetical protein